MSSGTADALGLSRAILCNGKLSLIISLILLDGYCLTQMTQKNRKNNLYLSMYVPEDGLVKRLEELEKTAELYKGEVATHCQASLKAFSYDTDLSWSEI